MNDLTFSAHPKHALQFDVGGIKEVVRIDHSGRIFWLGREVKTDDEFRTAMCDLSKQLTPKQWVGLTVEEIKEILYGLLEDDRTPMLTLIDVVQEKLKEKNNG